MMLRTLALSAAIAALAGAASAQQGPSAGLPPLNSGTPTTTLPSLQSPSAAPTGLSSDTAAKVAGTELAPADSVKDSLGREIDKMGKTEPSGTQGLAPLDSPLGANALMRPGSGLVTSSGQAANWIPKP